MGRKPKNLKVSSINGDKTPGENSNEQITTNSEQLKETKTPEVKVEDITHKPQKQISSPLLSEAVEIKDHAKGIGPGNQGPQNTNPFSNPVDGDFFQTKPYLGDQKPPVEVKAKTLQNPAPTLPPMKPDVPEQKFNMDPAAQGLESNPVVDQAAAQATSDLVDTLMTMYERSVPSITHDKTKIKSTDIREVEKFERTGDLTVGIAEDLKTQNKENKTRFEERCKSDSQMLKKPLKRWLTGKNIPLEPWMEVLLVAAFIALTYFFLIQEVKTSNQQLMESIMEKLNKIKEEKIPITPTEVVV